MRSREEKLEFKKELEARTLGFSIRVFKLLNALPKNSAMRVISYQLGKSASSIGANYREANRAMTLRIRSRLRLRRRRRRIIGFRSSRVSILSMR